MIQIFIILTIIHVSLVKSNDFSDCSPIENCTPQIAALDYNSINSSIDVRCKFNKKIDNPLDIVWKFQMEKGERMAVDMDGYVMPPFQHNILNYNDSFSNDQYSISVLKINLINSSYFTNYSIWSLNGGCKQTVRIHLKERALGYTNAASTVGASLYFTNLLSLLLIIYNVSINVDLMAR